MFEARITKPSKTAMQSGRGKSDFWILEFENRSERAPESVMGWTSVGDTAGQVRLKFKSLEEAVSYADAHGIAYSVGQDHGRKLKPRNYGDNFRYVPPAAKAEEKK